MSKLQQGLGLCQVHYREPSYGHGASCNMSPKYRLQ